MWKLSDLRYFPSQQISAPQPGRLFVSRHFNVTIAHMAHNNYYLDLCVDTFIVNDGAALLRLHEKYDMWNAPGGHIDGGEDINEAAMREAWEEVGLKVELVPPAGWTREDTEHNTDLIPPHFVNRHRINEVHEHSSLVFIAKSDSREINPQSDNDVSTKAQCVWVTTEELEEMHKNDKRLRYDAYRYAKTALAVVK